MKELKFNKIILLAALILLTATAGIRAQETDRTERPERPERPERAERAERTERSERVVRPNEAEGDEYTKTLNHEFDVNESNTLEVHNKFGDINLQNWQQNKVKIDVIITVICDKEERAQKILELINVEFSTEADIVKAITRLDEKLNK